MRKNAVKILIAALVIAGGVVLFRLTGLREIVIQVDRLQVWMESFGIWSYLVYMAIYILATVFLIPGSMLTIAAGIIFGSVIGGLLAIVSASVGASIAFLIARYAARDLIASKLGSNPLLKKIDEGVASNGVSFLILTRLVPVFPFNVQNYAYGLTCIPFSVYALVSALTMMPGAFIYAYMAGDIARNGLAPTLLLKFAGAGIILFLISLIPKYIAKKRGISMDDLKGKAK